jgi:hypothetical protein
LEDDRKLLKFYTRTLEYDTKRLKSDTQDLKSHIKKLESFYLDRPKRAISTGAPDALDKDTECRKEETFRMDEDSIHYGDIRSDAMMVTERYTKSSTVWKAFSTLYGLTPDDVNSLGMFYKVDALFTTNIF